MQNPQLIKVPPVLEFQFIKKVIKSKILLIGQIEHYIKQKKMARIELKLYNRCYSINRVKLNNFIDKLFNFG